MIILRLAFKNIYSGGLRTWLNVIALSLSYVAIIFTQGFYIGITHQIERSTVNAQYGGGQYWQSSFDPYNILTIDDAHGKIPGDLEKLISEKKAVPLLTRQATIYPKGRLQNTLLNGISPEQAVLTLPADFLKTDEAAIPAFIGSRMAKNTGLKTGDYVTVRWRDINGTFDADEIIITQVMKTDVPEIDTGQIWIPIKRLQQMAGIPGEATKIVLEKDSEFSRIFPGWIFKDIDFLLKDARALIAADNAMALILYAILMILAMIAIFDTQILAIFRRKKEIGTLMALGMTRSAIVRLFTVEGGMYAIFAAAVAALYGTPILIYAKAAGFSMPESIGNFGYAIGDTIYPMFTPLLIAGTAVLITATTTIVSYLPARKIAKLNPTDALRGKIT